MVILNFPRTLSTSLVRQGSRMGLRQKAFIFNTTDYFRKSDGIVREWWFMSNPLPVLLLIGAYLYTILHLGPRYMKTRQPFRLNTILQVYNAYQVLFSTWHCFITIRDGLLTYSVTKSCYPLEQEGSMYKSFLTNAWWYFFSKIIELLDTIFFVLRKKHQQITFFHVFHHGFTVFSSWCFLKYMPGEQGIIVGFLNSFVHIIMYSYYFLSACGPQYQKYLWWKKHLTCIQLIQFMLIILYLFIITISNCLLPLSVTFFFLGQAIIFICLFLQFYFQTYLYRGTVKTG